MNEWSTIPAADFMTIEELARRMRIGRTTAYELARANDLPVPAIKVGRQYRFPRKAFEALTAPQSPASE